MTPSTSRSGIGLLFIAGAIGLHFLSFVFQYTGYLLPNPVPAEQESFYYTLHTLWLPLLALLLVGASAAVLIALALVLGGPQALAQNWPAKTVRIIVPFAPGGTADTLGRLVAQRLTESLKENFIVEKNLSHDEGVEFGYAAGVSWPLRGTWDGGCRFCASAFTPAVEVYGGLGTTAADVGGATRQFVAPVITWGVSEGSLSVSWPSKRIRLSV